MSRKHELSCMSRLKWRRKKLQAFYFLFFLMLCHQFPATVIAQHRSEQIVNNPELIELRNKLNRIDKLMKRGIFTEPVTGRKYFTGYAYETLYDWDQYFESIIQIYMGWPVDYIKNAVLIFLDNQKDSGMIARSVPSNEFHDNEHVKPFLAQQCILYYKAYGDIQWILQEPYFSKLKKYIDYWLIGMDENKNKLSEWMSAPHTGMDTQHERAGYWLEHFCEGVDLNCYLVRELKAFSRIASIAGKVAIADEYLRLSNELKDRIRKEMWHEKDGFFYDKNKKNGRFIKVKAVSSFAVLWAEVATQEQAQRMVFEHLMNPREFWTPYPVSVIAKSEKGYSTKKFPEDIGCNWRANVWIPTNYMVYHGLRFYGFRKLASIVAHYTVTLVKKSGDRVYYNAETGKGIGLKPFWGWSLLAHFMLFEEKVEWDINTID